MKLNNINVGEAITHAEELINKDKSILSETKKSINVILMICRTMMERLSLDSHNSSKPPSSDFGNTGQEQKEKDNDEDESKTKKKKQSNRKPGGQPGRQGCQLKPVDNPDEIKSLKLDKRTLPRGGHYQPDGFEARQLFDLEISLHVTEYRAEVWIDEQGNRYVAPFPEGVTRPAQYGVGIQAHSVYLSQYQMIPYHRMMNHFEDQAGIPISVGTLHNFNRRAYDLLERFEAITVQKLINSTILHGDETGINVNSKRLWLHVACNDKWSLFAPHAKRGYQAMVDMGVLPHFRGILCHDHWSSYYRFDQCEHSLCNAHHERELTWSIEQDNQQWAQDFLDLLFKIKDKTEANGGELTARQQTYYQEKYRQCLLEAEKECPANTKRKAGQRGRIKQSKSRNLLVRLRDFMDDVLRFTTSPDIPFTNNQGENDIRMTKVKLKISGCFRSFEGTQIFCRIRGYLVTCRKHGIQPTEALKLLFSGKLPDFVDSN